VPFNFDVLTVLPSQAFSIAYIRKMQNHVDWLLYIWPHKLCGFLCRLFYAVIKATRRSTFQYH